MKLIHKATLINEGKSFRGSVLIEGERISKVFTDEVPENILQRCHEVIDAGNLYLIPGVIDGQVQLVVMRLGLAAILHTALIRSVTFE